MWLKQMVIDGFKSYAQRTVISDWDRHFTAITGLNGSGKSNILDAICFVLGITNLSQVRVENLQQLVYKEGQARVTKASVSLVFDNRDPNDSPIGYEDFDEITVTRQVVIGGRNKYMINGQTAQLGRIRDLFHSVQLDVNNPHFLIMQGRITKVLNMKPAEILGMIQEAAGTKMYELKKSQAIKTMNKKQVKVNEINTILEEEITPQLEKLRREKTHYLQWTKNNQEIDKLDRLMVVYQYNGNKVKVDTGNEKLSEMKEDINETKAQMEFLRDDIEKMKNDITVKQAQKSKDEQGAILKLSEELNANNKSLKSLEQQKKNEMDNIKRQNKELAAMRKTSASTTKLMETKNEEFKQCEQRHKEVDERYKYLQDRIDSLESQQLGIGMDDEKRDSGSLAQQLMEAKRLKSEFKSSRTTTKNKMKSIDKELGKLKKQIKGHEQKNQALRTEYQQKEAQLTSLKEQLRGISGDNMDDSKMEHDLQHDIDAKKERMYAIRNELAHLEREASQFDFQYHDPHRGFDRSKVYGKLGRLFTVHQAENCRALEICAGGRLYNVVVDHNETAKQLLQNGRLRHRVTIIPLNKIAARTISESVVERAKDLVGAEHCNLALELIGYEEQLDAAMRYAFGSALVCSDMNAAKQVAFTRGIECKSVTLDGEVFNPSGLLTGGSNNRGPSILQNMRQFQAKKEAFNALRAEIEGMERSMNEWNRKNQATEQLKERIDLLSHEVTVIGDRIKDSGYASLETRISELESERETLSTDLAELERKLATTEQKVVDLQQDMSMYAQRKKDQVKRVKEQIGEAKKEMKALTKDLKKSTEHKNRISQEIDDLKEEQAAGEGQIAEIEGVINEAQDKCKEIEGEIGGIKERKKGIEKELKVERKRLSAQDAELKRLGKIVAKNERQHNKMDIECAKLEAEWQNLNEGIKTAGKVIAAMLRKHEWLSEEAPEEVISGERYQEIAARSNKLKEQQSTLSNQINHKVMSMFERAEAEYRDLKKKREIIRDDKKKIESVIRELDKKKKDTLESTHKKVNEHFGNIFSRLLPGTQCKLNKIKNDEDDDEDESSILDGLEVKVAFGTDSNNNPIWKESLSELSGGQRSLLALSLILSLLLFKPAPLYILDEIDAALDLSHTQNIGILISKYFAKSQFIVVSLKEGMFTNANVIFRTSFIDGVSAVKRSVGVGLRNNAADKENRGNNADDDSNHNRRRPRAGRR